MVKVSANTRRGGFTLIELLVVLTIVALLLTLAAPQFLPNVTRAKEVVLREDLWTMRQAIDKYYSDKGNYPAKLDQLVSAHYLRDIPVDPLTDSSNSWVSIGPGDPGNPAGIHDIRSGATGKAHDGTAYGSW